MCWPLQERAWGWALVLMLMLPQQVEMPAAMQVCVRPAQC
jgi:hypothetical protein